MKLKLQYFGHLIQRADSLEKIPMLGKTRRQEEKEMTEDEMVGWHHQRNGHKSEQALGDGKGWYVAVHDAAKSWIQRSIQMDNYYFCRSVNPKENHGYWPINIT